MQVKHRADLKIAECAVVILQRYICSDFSNLDILVFE